MTSPANGITTRGYQQEMLEESLRRNIIIALDTGSGKTHIAVLRIKTEVERQPTKVSWFLAPTVALCEQQRGVIQGAISGPVGIISGSKEPDQWKNSALWQTSLHNNRVMVSTPQVLLDALRHSYVSLGRDISLLIFDEAHHAVDNHPYNRIMVEFYFNLPAQKSPISTGYQRPSILGLTASPIYGGNAEKAFKTIEANLDSTIRAPRRHKDELATFVHRPVFRHVMFNSPDEINMPFSTNLAALSAAVQQIDIRDDPYVHSLQKQLGRASPGSTDYYRLDQKLSKVIHKSDSFTHKGLRDFVRTAEAICYDLGSWAADWYIWEVIQHAKRAANPTNNIISTWKNQEKAYLLEIINRIVVTPVSHYPDDILEASTDKVRTLIDTLLMEKFDTEALNESYSGLVFVQRRDTVLALTELLRHHPFTQDVFTFGCLLGTSDSSYRHSFLDITRFMLKNTHEDTLDDFRIGKMTVIISTAVAEEGIDIQACGSVIRWDPPPNMASWAQSRGRARRKRSTYTMMFSNVGADHASVLKWQTLEQQMVALYNDPSRDMVVDDPDDQKDADDEVLEFRVPSTGALLTLNSAVSHLSHFCAVIPSTSHADNRPLYEIDPPEYLHGWHSFDNRSHPPLYPGPWGSKVTLPRSLPLPNREFVTEKIYKSRISAHRHAAFTAYKALYDAGLLTEHLLPITSVVEPQLDEEVKEMLKDVEQRAGFAKVSLQFDPWIPQNQALQYWHTYELIIGGLPPLIFFNTSHKISLPLNEGPTLFCPGKVPLMTSLRYIGSVSPSDPRIEVARKFTKMLFWSLNGPRMSWDKDDFPYLVLPSDTTESHWERRRGWLQSNNTVTGAKHADEYVVNAEKFGKEFSHPTDVTIVRSGFQFAKGYQFVAWRFEPLDEEEESKLRERCSRLGDPKIVYPLLEVRPLHPRTNFLIPTASQAIRQTESLFLLPGMSAISVLSPDECDYALLLPSILRSFACSMTVSSLRDELFTATPLSQIPDSLLLTALTAPVSGERSNYQRLETLGDTVLKYLVSIQLLAEYLLWHEGYLSKKKDHSVSNVRLAKRNITLSLYRWIIRDRMLGKKWKPNYIVREIAEEKTASSVTDTAAEAIEEGSEKKKKKPQQELSTKVLADVVESIIGASYLHGGFSLSYDCARLFDLGLRWYPIPDRIEAMLSRVQTAEEYPPQLVIVERLLGYTFTRKGLLIEALTHSSYEHDLRTPSYERMEFLGDSVLDMIVTDFLYHAPGKEYSPGHIHIRRSAVVNAHILSYLCLSSSTEVDATMPGVSQDGSIGLVAESHHIYLWQCLLHSSPTILEAQRNTATRYKHHKDEIRNSLEHGNLFPWANLIRLQAPKFLSDMVESLIGAVFLDSGGDINIATTLVGRLGILPILNRIVRDDVDVLHPVSRLSLWASKHGKQLEYQFEKAKGQVSCMVVVDEKEECRITEPYHGKASEEEVKFLASESAIKMFRLRDVDVNYTLLKERRASMKKTRKEGTKS